MIQRLATAAAVVLTALALALVSAWWFIVHPPGGIGARNGAWQTSVLTGSGDAGMYLRANVAITGLFALNASEAIYFSAGVDDNNQPLKARCTYLIEGQPVTGRWWSLTAYADDNFLIPNSVNRFSFNAGNLQSGASGTYRIIAAPTEQSGNWLPTGAGGGGFNLLFRIYIPPPATVTNPRSMLLPSIKPLGACT